MLFYLIISISIFLFLIYSYYILNYKKHFKKLLPFVNNKSHKPTIFFSIIIPARNEENDISNCIQSILQFNYPKDLFEIIIVDDFSTDSTTEIITEFQKRNSNIKLINLENEIKQQQINSYKKKAIEIAISKSIGDWIITTDADCVLPKELLMLYDEYILINNAVFVAAPVLFYQTKSIISQFQFLDFLTMQAITAASVKSGLHTMCNGANLAYKKEVFYKVDGFNGIDNIASGDDMFLMYKIKKLYSNCIGYLNSKDSIVLTQPMLTLKEFFNQRIRWASKADKFQDKSLFPILFTTYMFNFFLVILFLLGFYSAAYLKIFFVFLFLKILIEWAFLSSVKNLFGKLSLFQFVLYQPMHIIYIVIAGWLGKFGSYTWKARNVK